MSAETVIGGLVSRDHATTVALGFSSIVFGAASVETAWALTGVDGQPAAYMYSMHYVDSVGKANTGTLLVSARDDLGPVFMHYKGEAVLRTSLARATELAEARCGVVRLGRVVYYSPLDIWFEFIGNRESVYVSPYDFQTLGSANILVRSPLRIDDAETRDIVRKDWQRLASSANDSGPSQFRISHVPDIDWSFGCGPTATGNILEYWNNSGYLALTDSWYVRWDAIQGEWDTVTNAMWELAVAAHTDTMESGNTNLYSMISAVNEVCDSSWWNNGYRFYCYSGGDDHDLMTGELTLVRPVLWLLTGHPKYGNHFVTAMGWGPPDQAWICIHDEWKSTPEEVVIQYNNWGGSRYVAPILPDGGHGGKNWPLSLSVTPSVGAGPFAMKIGPLLTNLLTLDIYDATGRVVRDLYHVQVGPNRVRKLAWDAKDDDGRSLRCGTYFIALRNHDGTWVRKVSLVR